MSDQDSTARPGPTRFTGDDGANLVEYSMLVALIVVVCLSAVTFFGRSATEKMSCASSAIGAANSGGGGAVTNCSAAP